MNRRDFVGAMGAAAVASVLPGSALAQHRGYDRTLVLVELKGGNDGLNTVVPYADEEYYALRPAIGIARSRVLQLDERAGLHPSLEPLMALWNDRELAVVQGVGYPDPNLSHFRSIEIWDTASKSNEYLSAGWLARAFMSQPAPPSFAADAVVVGGAEMGPFAGGARAIAVTDTERFLREAGLAQPRPEGGNPALAHILKVERDIVQAAANLRADHVYATAFPATTFGNAIRTAARIMAGKAGVAAVKVSLNGFDTHISQPGTQARLLKDLAEGLAALRTALVEIGRWNSTLIMTYAEFGRRPRENRSNGTDHGTASAHFVLGGRVKGGLYGPAPALNRLDGNGNLPYATDFRDLYAAVLSGWWGLDSNRALRGRFTPVEVLKA